MKGLRSLGSLAVASALLTAGALEAAPEGSSANAALLAAGLVVLGSWIAVEIWHHAGGSDDRHDR